MGTVHIISLLKVVFAVVAHVNVRNIFVNYTITSVSDTNDALNLSSTNSDLVTSTFAMFYILTSNKL